MINEDPLYAARYKIDKSGDNKWVTEKQDQFRDFSFSTPLPPGWKPKKKSKAILLMFRQEEVEAKGEGRAPVQGVWEVEPLGPESDREAEAARGEAGRVREL